MVLEVIPMEDDRLGANMVRNITGDGTLLIIHSWTMS